MRHVAVPREYLQRRSPRKEDRRADHLLRTSIGCFSLVLDLEQPSKLKLTNYENKSFRWRICRLPVSVSAHTMENRASKVRIEHGAYEDDMEDESDKE